MLTDNEMMAQVLAAFQEEQAEHRQAIGELLLDLERSPNHPQRQALLDQLFRQAHSLKGGARAAGQMGVERIAHLIEDLFSAVRQDQLALTAEICDPIYAALDAMGVLMQSVAAGQSADLAPYQPLLATLSAISETHSALPPLIRHQKPYQLPAMVAIPDPLVAATAPPVQSHPPDTAEQSSVRLSTASLDHLLHETGELLTCALSARQRANDLRQLADVPTRWRRTWRQIRPDISRLQSRSAHLQPIVHYLADAPLPNQATLVHAPNLDHATARLLEALEQANALIGEMEGRLASYARQTSDDATRLSAATDRLHDQIRRTRMLPLSTLFAPLRLQVREMARTAEKQVALVVEDGGVAADRQVLDRLREALLHLLRNAIDHGIEAPDVRNAAGKPTEGQITLHAAVQGESLTLTIADDGAGLNLDQIRQRALSSGLISEADLGRASAADVIDIIFMAGFTTRQTVSALSGRGVGLDIVRSLIERTHGRVTVQSVSGQGCTFTIVVPLSLTTSHCLLVRCGTITYALPLDAVQQIVMLGPTDIRTVEGRPVLVLDHRPVPIVHLADLLNSQRTADRIAERTLALLLGTGERQVTCMVDAVVGEQELVMLRLPAPLQQVHLIAGATILADGSVVPILDPVDLLRAALGLRHATVVLAGEAAPQQAQTVLVVDDSITTRTLEKNILEAAGYRVRLATDGLAALQLLDQMADAKAEDGGCDLLLSDVDMPLMNGFDLTSAVRADPRFCHMPVVLVTSLDTPADRERGISAGADSYIVKRGFDQQVLLDTIAQLL